MMQFVLKYRWAFIGTIVLHLAVMLYLEKRTIPRHYQPITELQQIPIVLEQPDEEEKKDPEKDPDNPQTGKVSNITANEADKITKTSQNYNSRSFKNLEQDVEEDLKNFEKNAFDEYAATHKHTVDVPGEQPKNNRKTPRKEDTPANNANDASRERMQGRVSGSYDLAGRRDETFAKPAYVCKGSGTVVLNIKVNRSGKVVAAAIDRGESSFTEACMGDNAVKYAYRCKFEASSSYPDPQSGTITYTYVSQ